MRTFLSQAGLARQLGLGENTVAGRIRARAVNPDGILIQPGNKVDVLLFATERVPELRGALGNQKPVEASIKI